MRVSLKLPVFLLLAAACTLPAAAATFFEPVQPPRAVQVMAHRGAWQQAPENTAPALERCVEDGFEWMEVDLRLTSDRQHIICHNATVDGVTDGAGEVSKMSVAELKALDAGVKFAPRFAGTRLLTLRECLALAKGRINLYLDCKAIDPGVLVEEVLAADMAAQVVVYDAPDAIAKVQELSKKAIPVMTKWHPEFGTEDWVARWQPDAVEINAVEVTPEICAWFHGKGIKVQAKVLDEADTPETWDRMIAAGVDWLQTDLSDEIMARQAWVSRKEKPVEISFHRGANVYAPENTIAAFDKSVRMGADYVEFDVRTTRDGAFFMMHDRTVDRTTDGKGPIAEMDTAAVRALDAGSWFGAPFVKAGVPTLAESLAVLGGHTKLYVDAKSIPAPALAEFLQKNDLTEQSVVYQSPQYLAELHGIDPKIRGLCPLGDPAKIQELAETVHPYGFDTSWGILSQELIQQCHGLGIKVFSDAMDEHEKIEEYQQAIRWGIDLIQTDYPLRVMRAVELLQTQR